MKFNWKYTIISIVLLAISLVASTFLFGEQDSSAQGAPSSAPSTPSAPAGDANYSL